MATARLDIATVARLAAAGQTDPQIAVQFGVTKDAVRAARNRHGIPSPIGPHGEVLHRPDPAAVAGSLDAYAGPRATLTLDEEQQAICAQTDPEIFFPETGVNPHAAKAICSRCPIKDRCLEVAIANREPAGIWGGLAPRERQAIILGMPTPPPKRQGRPLTHGTRAGYERHKRNGEPACTPCHDANALYHAERRGAVA